MGFDKVGRWTQFGGMLSWGAWVSFDEGMGKPVDKVSDAKVECRVELYEDWRWKSGEDWYLNSGKRKRNSQRLKKNKGVEKERESNITETMFEGSEFQDKVVTCTHSIWQFINTVFERTVSVNWWEPKPYLVA